MKNNIQAEKSMTIKEKVQKVIALAMSIEPTDRYCLTFDWNGETNSFSLYVVERINGKSEEIVESYTYYGDDVILSFVYKLINRKPQGVMENHKYITFDALIERLNRIKSE